MDGSILTSLRVKVNKKANRRENNFEIISNQKRNGRLRFLLGKEMCKIDTLSYSKLLHGSKCEQSVPQLVL